MLEFLSITLLIILAVISPGPDFALVTRNALVYSRQVGILTALGIALGTLCHATYCILGLAIVISKSLLAFNVIKYMGAAYLIYLGVKGLLAKPSSAPVAIHEHHKRPISSFAALSQGFLCNVLNPKAILFFLALFTLMIKPSWSWQIQVSYALEIALLHFSWFAGLAYVFSHHRVKSSLNKFQYYITKLLGGFLIAFGIKVAAFTDLNR